MALSTNTITLQSNMKYDTIMRWCRKVDIDTIIEAINEHCDNEGTTDHIHTDSDGNWYSMRGNTERKMTLSEIRLYYYNVVCDGDIENMKSNINDLI